MTPTEERRLREVRTILLKHNLSFNVKGMYAVILELDAENTRLKAHLEKRVKLFRAIVKQAEAME